MFSRFPAAVAFLVLAAAAAWANPGATSKTYPVQLQRPVKAGYKFRLTGTAELEKTTTLSYSGTTQPAQSLKMNVAIDAAVEVVKVDAKGRPAEELLTIATLTSASGGEAKKVLDKDQVVIVKAVEGKTTYELKDGTISDDAKDALETVVTLQVGDADQDDLFGSKEPRQAGDAWPVNAEALVSNFRQDNMTVDKPDVTGQVTLVGERKVGDQPVLEVAAVVKIAKVQVNPETLAPGLSIDTSTLKTTLSLLLPVDAALPPVGEKQSMEFTMVMSGQSGTAKLQATVHGKASRDLKYEAVK